MILAQRLCLALCLMLGLANLAPPAAAQTVPVRSGAHDGFDRLVIDLPTRRSWRIERREKGASMIFDGAGPRFDLGAVFDRIGRQRLRSISAPGDGRLDLEFTCDCRIEPFWHDGPMLVIDISDPPGAARTSPARPRPRPVETLLPDRRAKDGLPALYRFSAGAALAKRLDARIGPRLSALPDTLPAAVPPDDALASMRVALGQQLGRAASQGLVTPTPHERQHLAPRPPASDTVASSTAPVSVSPPPETPLHPAIPGLRITTSMDRDISGSAQPDAGMETCPQVAHIDVAAWGGDGPFAAEVGRLNSALFGEFDTVQEAAALRLARLYIHHGFGAEARQVLGWLDTASPEITLARDLALIVDTLRLPADAALADALGCDEPGVLWAILAMPELPEDRVLDHRALQRSFSALPEGLRRAFGPVLVQRLVAAGHVGTADALLRQIRGGDALSDAEADMARAAMADKVSTTGVAETSLHEITRTNAAQTGVALADMIERVLAREAPVAFADAQLAGALAFEHRGTPLGERLTLAYLSALAASGAFDEAITEFERLRPSLGDDAEPRVASVLVIYLLRQGDDVTFLRIMTADRIAPPGALDVPVALGVARRFLDLGFSAQAARHVASAEPVENSDDRKARRILRARIFLAQDRPTEAVQSLRGLTGGDADLLRADAFAAQGDHADARQLFRAHDAVARADRSALHLGRAAVLAEAENPQLREIGQIMATDDAAPALDAEAGVAAHRALLDRSTALRGAMQRLLAEMPAQADRQ